MYTQQPKEVPLFRNNNKKRLKFMKYKTDMRVLLQVVRSLKPCLFNLRIFE